MPDGPVTMAKLAAKGLSTDLEVTGSVGCHFLSSFYVMCSSFNQFLTFNENVLIKEWNEDQVKELQYYSLRLLLHSVIKAWLIRFWAMAMHWKTWANDLMYAFYTLHSWIYYINMCVVDNMSMLNLWVHFGGIYMYTPYLIPYIPDLIWTLYALPYTLYTRPYINPICPTLYLIYLNASEMHISNV